MDYEDFDKHPKELHLVSVGKTWWNSLINIIINNNKIKFLEMKQKWL